MVLDSPAEHEQHTVPAYAAIGVAFAASLLVHVGVLLVGPGIRDQPLKAAPASVPLQIRLAPRVAERVTESVPIPPADPELSRELPQPSTAEAPPAGEHAQTSPPLPEATVPPARVSILRSVDAYVADLPPSSEDLPKDTNLGSGNIFHPALRRTLRAPEGGRPDESLHLLNDSTVADAFERVSLDGKCFRLQDLGGGGDKRAWYPVKCRGKQSTSDAMARGLEEALERR